MTVQTRDAICTTTRPILCSSCRITVGACMAGAQCCSGACIHAAMMQHLVTGGLVQIERPHATAAVANTSFKTHLEKPEYSNKLEHSDNAQKLDDL
jgi:hypothetical protein